jgi:RNA polymerase sigma-70 factor (ECF subfamily)
VVTGATTLARARAGSEAAFGELTEPHRRALLVHCYRLLGSLQDAEDAVQETFVAAWRGLDGFEERASLRAWLYRIATNRCLNMRRDAARRPAAARRLPFVPPAPTRLGEAPWLEPFPDALLEGLPDAAPGPDARYEEREAVGLAFVTALQRLPARQRAALVLRDVLGYRAAEAAALLGATEATVTSALQRARTALEERLPPARERAPAPGSEAERAAAERFADAFAAGDVDRVVALLTDDAWVTMPPEPFEYQGRAAIAAVLHAVRADARARGGREARLLPTRANGQPAFGHYLREAGAGGARGSGLIVLELEGGAVAAIARFGDAALLARFGLPPSVPG